jgi:sugar lactone lactonase YvrE
MDQAGNLYVTDNGNTTVRKVTPAGQVTTLAGQSGQPGTNDGRGAAAQFYYPLRLAVDPSGVVYVLDGGGVNTIRRVSSAGQVTTIAGTPYVSGTNDGTGPAAQFLSPTSLRFGPAGSLYLADNLRIRNITPAGVVTTVYGGYPTAFPNDVLAQLTVGSSGIVYASDDTLGGVLKIDLGTQVASILASGINGPSGVTIAAPGSPAAGTVFVSDGAYGSAIYTLGPGGLVNPFAGSTGLTGYVDGAGTAARFQFPAGMFMTVSGTQYVADAGNNVIRKVTAGGGVSTVAGTAAHPGYVDAKGSAARFYDPRAMAVDLAGAVYVADGNGIRRVSAAGAVTTAFVPPQRGDNFVVDSAGNMYYTRPEVSNDIVELTSAGVLSVVAGSRIPGYQDGNGVAAGFFSPHGIARDASGNLYVADTNAYTIRKISPTGQVTTLAGSPGTSGTADGAGSSARFTRPNAITLDKGGVLYIVDGNAVRTMSTAGVVSTLAGSQAAGYADGTGAAAQFSAPTAITVSPAGTVFVSDTGNNVVRKISSSGQVTTVIGKRARAGVRLGALPASLNSPAGLVYAGSILYVADSAENSVFAATGLF